MASLQSVSHQVVPALVVVTLVVPATIRRVSQPPHGERWPRDRALASEMLLGVGLKVSDVPPPAVPGAQLPGVMTVTWQTGKPQEEGTRVPAGRHEAQGSASLDSSPWSCATGENHFCSVPGGRGVCPPCRSLVFSARGT